MGLRERPGSFVLVPHSLRSKRFQSSYCAKVRAEAKKKVEGGGSLIFFCSCPSFLDEPHQETLATQAMFLMALLLAPDGCSTVLSI